MMQDFGVTWEVVDFAWRLGFTLYYVRLYSQTELCTEIDEVHLDIGQHVPVHQLPGWFVHRCGLLVTCYWVPLSSGRHVRFNSLSIVHSLQFIGKM